MAKYFVILCKGQKLFAKMSPRVNFVAALSHRSNERSTSKKRKEFCSDKCLEDLLLLDKQYRQLDVDK